MYRPARGGLDHMDIAIHQPLGGYGLEFWMPGVHLLLFVGRRPDRMRAIAIRVGRIYFSASNWHSWSIGRWSACFL